MIGFAKFKLKCYNRSTLNLSSPFVSYQRDYTKLTIQIMIIICVLFTIESFINW